MRAFFEISNCLQCINDSFLPHCMHVCLSQRCTDVSIKMWFAESFATVQVDQPPQAAAAQLIYPTRLIRVITEVCGPTMTYEPLTSAAGNLWNRFSSRLSLFVGSLTSERERERGKKKEERAERERGRKEERQRLTGERKESRSSKLLKMKNRANNDGEVKDEEGEEGENDYSGEQRCMLTEGVYFVRYKYWDAFAV